MTTFNRLLPFLLLAAWALGFIWFMVICKPEVNTLAPQDMCPKGSVCVDGQLMRSK